MKLGLAFGEQLPELIKQELERLTSIISAAWHVEHDEQDRHRPFKVPIGYGAGVGGVIGQLTSKSTGVTLSALTGEITLHNAALAAATAVSFVLTNSLIAAGDLVLVAHHSGGTAGAYTLTAQPGYQSVTITVRNVTAGSLSEAIVIKFAVFKAVTA